MGGEKGKSVLPYKIQTGKILVLANTFQKNS